MHPAEGPSADTADDSSAECKIEAQQASTGVLKKSAVKVPPLPGGGGYQPWKNVEGLAATEGAGDDSEEDRFSRSCAGPSKPPFKPTS